MSPQTFLKQYERALATQSWPTIEPFIANDACFIFSEGTYHGKAAIGEAIRATFALIKHEQYGINDVHWVHLQDDCALCTYAFSWQGVIDGEQCAGTGRGTSLLVKDGTRWAIKHEHLGPAA